MKQHVRLAKREDLPKIEEIYAYARAFMASTGNPNQWGTSHPPHEQLEQDVIDRNLYVITDHNEIHGVFAFILGEDATYLSVYDGDWHAKQPYGTIHRIAGDGCGGILQTAVAYAKERISYLRIDTHHDNKVMQGAIQKVGFQRCGIIFIEDGTPRIAYDLLAENV